MKIILFGLAVTSSWGNGHATTYRALVRGLVARGHDVLFLERDMPWYAENRDLQRISGATIELYGSLAGLKRRFRSVIARADAVIVGSFVPDGIELGRWVLRTAAGVVGFYDIDTPVTLAAVAADECAYLTAEMIRNYPLYLSFTGGPMLERLESELGSPCARALYCGVDPADHRPLPEPKRWDLGYLGTYAADRQPALQRLMLAPAAALASGRFVIAGSQYPKNMRWPENVARIAHLAPDEHGRFYAQQRFTLNITRAAMRRAGYSPSVRLFEAAACGTPIITDGWPGLDTVFQPGAEVIVAASREEVIRCLEDMPEAQAAAIGAAARARVLAHHTGVHRAGELESHLRDARAVPSLTLARSSRRVPRKVACARRTA